MKVSACALLTAIVVLCGVPTEVQQLQSVTLNYPTRSGASWPLFIAKEGGYYRKYGLDVTLVFAGHPAGIAMCNEKLSILPFKNFIPENIMINMATTAAKINAQFTMFSKTKGMQLSVATPFSKQLSGIK